MLSRVAKPRDRSLTTQQVNKRPWCSGNPSACHAEDASSILAGRSAGWSSGLARQAHNLEIDGSNPSPATYAGRWKVWPGFMERPVVRNHEFKSDRPDSVFPRTFRCGQTVRQPPVKRMSAGSIPATGAFSSCNRFRVSTIDLNATNDLLMQTALRRGKPIGDGSRLATNLRSVPGPSTDTALRVRLSLLPLQ